MFHRTMTETQYDTHQIAWQASDVLWHLNRGEILYGRMPGTQRYYGLWPHFNASPSSLYQMTARELFDVLAWRTLYQEPRT